MSVTTTLLDHLQATSPHGVYESAHSPLRQSHPFLLQQLSQVCQSAVFCDSAIYRTLELVPKMLNWVEIRRVRRPHHSLNSRTSQELGDDSTPVRAGVIVHKDETITNGSGMWYNMWAQNFSNISNGIQISVYLYKRCLVGKGNITPDHNTTATKGCNWLYTAFRMLFPPPAPDTSSSINMPERQARISSVNKTFFHCCLVHRECALAHLKRASRCRNIKIAFLTKRLA